MRPNSGNIIGDLCHKAEAVILEFWLNTQVVERQLQRRIKIGGCSIKPSIHQKKALAGR
jgi:hypothetical protein